MNQFYKFQERHKYSILFILFAITIFFAITSSKLKINADFSSLFNQTQPITYYGGGDFDKNEIERLLYEYSSLEKTNPKDYAKIPINEKFDENASYNYPETTNYEESPQNKSGLLLLISSKNFFTPVFLNTLDICLQNLYNQKETNSINSVFDYFTISKKGTRLAIVPISNHKKGTKWTNEEVQILKNKIANDPTITGYMVSQNLESVIFNLGIPSLSENEIYSLLKTLEPLEDLGASFAITGLLPITYRIMYYLSHDLALLLFLSLIVILIVFYLSFRAKRSMLLPFSLSIIAIIWTFGTMVLLGYEITLINIVTPCMVLTLGSSYSVHLINEYYTQFNKNKSKNISFIAATNIWHTIFFAGLTTIAGFLSLLISEIDGLFEFGISVSIGIIYCEILALTYLPIMLSLVKKPKANQIKVVNDGILTKIIRKTSNIVLNKYHYFCILFLIVIIGFIFTKNKISIDTNYMSYFPSSDRIANDTKEVSIALGGDMPYVLTLKAPEGENKYFLKSENLEKVFEFEKQIKQSPDILQNISFSSYVAYINSLNTGKEEIPEKNSLIILFSKIMTALKVHNPGLLGRVISEDSNTLNIYLQTYDSQNKDITTVGSSATLEALIHQCLPILPEGISITFKGTNSEALRFSNQLMKDQRNSQLLAYLIVFIIASLAFRSLIRGALTLIPVAVGVMANYIFMYFLNIPFDMVTVSFASVAIGAGVDDAIHFLLKFSKLKEENKNWEVKTILNQTLKETGRPIVLTTLSIVLGMMMLNFGSYIPIKYFGLLMSIALMNSMLATIFILPAIILFIDRINKKLIRDKK